MSRVFINYRREDTSSQASRLYEWLEARYGGESVFKDVDTIEPGLDWREAIDRAVGSSDVVIALIGKDWLPILQQRSGDEDDYVREELEAALRRDIRVIPVLVDDVQMPAAAELPAGLMPLTRRQAFELSDARWRFDKEELLRRLDRVLGTPAPASTPARTSPPAFSALQPAPPPPSFSLQPATAGQQPSSGGALESVVVEAELKKWNWGAFLLTWIWGIGNGVFRSLLVFVPLYGFYEWFLLGMKGNRWAWEKRRWQDIEHFRRAQKTWATAGFIATAILIVIIIAASGTSSE